MAAAAWAPFSYGVATHYARAAKSVEGFSNAHGSKWAASVMMIPALPFATVTPAPGTGIAFLLYFRQPRNNA